MEADVRTAPTAASSEATSAARILGPVSATTGASRAADEPVGSGTDTAPRYMQARSMTA